MTPDPSPIESPEEIITNDDVARLVADLDAKSVQIGGLNIHRVYSRNRTEVGVPTGGTRFCSCGGLRIGVRWPDGKITWPCSKAMHLSPPVAELA